jgi:hydroxymethylpyrimidine/phosphomethylpyrimidine kinase
MRARPTMTTSPPIVVVFAASDPTAGAGLQADLLTLAALRCHAATVVTALTVQDTHGVHRVQALGTDWVEQQARALLAELPVTAFKIGVIGSAANAAAIARIVDEHPQAPIVFDPVLASGRGDLLAAADTLTAMRELLVPRCAVLTPNSVEARRLAGAADGADLAQAARRLVALGARHVLITGSHEPTPDVVNTLYGARGAVREDRWPRLAGSFHGSGCTLASALAAHLARGFEIAEAARAAQEYAWRTLAAAFRPGTGQLIPQRLCAPGGEPR